MEYFNKVVVQQPCGRHGVSLLGSILTITHINHGTHKSKV